MYVLRLAIACSSNGRRRAPSAVASPDQGTDPSFSTSVAATFADEVPESRLLPLLLSSPSMMFHSGPLDCDPLSVIASTASW